MTRYHLGQDGRMGFMDQSDAELKTRRSQLIAEGNAILGQKSLTRGDHETAQAKANHIKAIDAELKGRAERRSGGGATGGHQRIDHHEGTIGSSGLGGESKGYLTSAAIKNAGERLAAKITEAREGKSLTAAGGTEVTVVDPGLAPMGRPTTVLDVVPVIGASAPAIRYMRQTSRTNAAAVVAAWATKPTSEYGITPVDRTRKVLAHLSEPLQEYDLQDVPALMEFVNTELQFGLIRALENELFNGDGTAAHLHGIAQESGVQTQAFATNLFATTRKAVTAVTTLGYLPKVFVLGPADLETIDLATTSGSGEFVNKGGPFDPAEQKLWGVPVVVSTQLGAKTGYLISEDSVRVYSDVGAAVRVE
ncbi:phage major capsid protein [Gordonia sp. OPL2]|uniref:phage major capsid protein n=1 Tax=Gordonia sp. OPL2 TaxID=2486274 RepID=UPI0021CD0BC5|nr:phage major capsid protein [Gordonia sp. OPL2]